jgi:hypothetical protein
VPLRVWFLGIFFLARHKTGISARQFQRDTGLGSYQTAWTLLHRLRSGLTAHPAQCLNGDVEADETYIGGHRPGQLGRGVGKTGVAIAVERRARTAGKVRLAVIPRATTAVLTSFVHASIQPQESTVFTDGWGAYIALRDLGIDHRPRKGGNGRQSVLCIPKTRFSLNHGHLSRRIPRRGAPRPRSSTGPTVPVGAARSSGRWGGSHD